MTEEYRVNLDIYNGPLDLLLYLIRREEVDIYDIPIARITAQYIEYAEMIQQLDPNLAGDFLVMAATLIEIKTRMLLPTAVAEDGEEEISDLDPRSELVRQLLQYKAFKDAAADLEDAQIAQEKKHPRRPTTPELPDQPDKSLEDLQIWDLFDAFSRLLESIGAVDPTHDVIYDDTPIYVHAEDLLDRLTLEGPIRF
jgi:segregation and condensation protein A